MNLSAGNVGGDTLFKVYSNLWGFINMEAMYQEIYENGTFFVAAAGNGYTQDTAWHSRWYNYPASLDYVFSVSGVGWKNPYSGTSNVSGLQERVKGDSLTAQTHNSRVDLLAPSFEIGGLDWYGGHSDGTGISGTSLAAPLVAGTAGLILAKDSCYTPYQLEYILKQTADTNIFHRPENEKYRERLGAGKLDAGKALERVHFATGNPASLYSCNNPATTTLFIEGIDFNTLCVPGRSSNGVSPKLTPILKNGTPPYTARWEPMDKAGNLARLNAYDVFSPEISSATEFNLGGSYFVYRLTVTDNSPVPKTASRVIEMALTSGELSSKQYELTGRDAYMDMVLEEPNLMDSLDRRDNNFFMSPDLWNRQSAAYNPEHQKAEYTSSDSNYAFVRIRNVGCKQFNPTTNPTYLKLYWTVASTGEHWKSDWDGTGTSVNGQVCGGELTSGNGIPVKALNPGDTMIIRKGWQPVEPIDYGTNDLNVCLLARIVNNSDNAGPEVNGPVITNVRNNNNIFTRNLWIGDLYSGNTKAKTRMVIANANAEVQTFDIQFINDKSIHRHFAGNYSSVGYVTLYLGDLYNLWIQAGGQGTYLSRSADSKTVVMDGSQTLELLNIPLATHAKYPIDIEFSLHSGITIPNYSFDFHLRQFEVEDGQRSPDPYGSLSFQVNTLPEIPARKAGTSDGLKQGAVLSGFTIYPNPVKTDLTISYRGENNVTADVIITDVVGRILIRKEHQGFSNSSIDVTVSHLPTGVYVVEITNEKGIRYREKFVKE